MKHTLSSSSCPASLAVFATLTMTLFFCTLANAEEQPGTLDAEDQQASSAATGSSAAAQGDTWHVGLTLYLWFPGVHGTTGAGGPEVDFRASPGDLLSNFRFGLMGVAEARYGRYVILSDLMWVRLGANKQAALPFPGLPELTAEVKSYQLIFNPEFGYRALDSKHVKLDAVLGFRYWDLGSSLQFTPSLRGLNFSGSQNWIDPLMGALIQVPLSRRVLVTIWGDAGGWGAGSELDYQIVGAISFKIKRKFSLGAGYRYLFVNYSPTSFIFKTAMSGAVVGLTYNLK